MPRDLVWNKNASPVGWYLTSYLLRFVELDDVRRDDENKRFVSWENRADCRGSDGCLSGRSGCRGGAVGVRRRHQGASCLRGHRGRVRTCVVRTCATDLATLAPDGDAEVFRPSQGGVMTRSMVAAPTVLALTRVFPSSLEPALVSSRRILRHACGACLRLPVCAPTALYIRPRMVHREIHC